MYINPKVLTILDFSGSGCPSCKTIGKFLPDLASSYGDKVEFVLVNADVEEGLLEQYEVLSLPTVIFFKNGEMIKRLTGAYPEKDYKETIEQNI